MLAAPKTEREKETIRLKLGVKEKKVIVSVGRIIPSKGYDVLIESIKDLGKDVGVYIISGPPDKDLEELIHKYHLCNVHFFDYMPKERLWDYYQMADLLALPTRKDTWGLFVNEAMANGLPVITTKMCMAGLELISDGDNGFLIEVDDVKDSLEKIQYLLNNPQKCHEMGKNNIEIIKNYTFGKQAIVTLNSIESVK